jgi:hypothetical protein
MKIFWAGSGLVVVVGSFDEFAGRGNPDGMQHRLARAVLDDDAVAVDVRHRARENYSRARPAT